MGMGMYRIVSDQGYITGIKRKVSNDRDGMVGGGGGVS